MSTEYVRESTSVLYAYNMPVAMLFSRFLQQVSE